MGKSTDMPAAPDPRQAIELQAEVNRIGANTPFGQQFFARTQGGGHTLNTALSPEMQRVAAQQLQLGSARSAQQGADPRLNALAGALSSRIGDRLGLDLGGGGLALTGQPQMGQMPNPSQLLPMASPKTLPGNWSPGVDAGGPRYRPPVRPAQK